MAYKSQKSLGLGWRFYAQIDNGTVLLLDNFCVNPTEIDINIF